MSEDSPHSAVLLLAHGTPNVLGEMAEYLSKVTGGRALPNEVVVELQHRYALDRPQRDSRNRTPPPHQMDHSAGPSARTNSVDSRLHRHAQLAPLHSRRRSADASSMAVKHIKAICLAPQNSRTSVGLYRRAVWRAAGLEVDFVAGWAEHPLLAQAFAEKLLPVWTKPAPSRHAHVPVLFTAHTVPCRTIMTGEASMPEPAPAPSPAIARPLPSRSKAHRHLVAEACAPVGFSESDWYFAFQSQGMSGGPWIGPTVEDTLKAIKAKATQA